MSDLFHQYEDKTGDIRVLQDEFVTEIARHLNKEKSVIEQVIYTASVSTSTSPLSIAQSVYEFVASLCEAERMKEQGDQHE